MVLPDEIPKCVVFLGLRRHDGHFQVAGTGFFVRKQRAIRRSIVTFDYLVTAKHVIEGIRDIGVQQVSVRLNPAGDGNAFWLTSEFADWYFHPTDSSIDVAVHYVPPLGRAVDHLWYPLAAHVTPDLARSAGIGAGEEVFTAGLFSPHYGRVRNIPIIRVGNIAAMPDEPVGAPFGPVEAYLIECRSIAGLSGSPVFLHLGIVRRSGTGQTVIDTNHQAVGSSIHLLGLVQGHFDVSSLEPISSDGALGAAEKINVGIAIVVPASRMVEVLDQPATVEMEDGLIQGATALIDERHAEQLVFPL